MAYVNQALRCSLQITECLHRFIGKGEQDELVSHRKVSTHPCRHNYHRRDVCAAVSARAAKKSDDVKMVAPLTRVAVQMDRVLVIPWSNIMILMGIILAVIQKWPVFGFLQGASQNWLLVSNILLIVMLGLIPGVFIPHNKKVEALLQTALTEESVTPELSAALNDKKNVLAHHAEEIIVLVVAALMVLKPF